jgi:hypothetical protein
MSSKTVTGKMTPAMFDQFLANPLLARIATANPETLQPHVVPVWYTWEDGSLWISNFTSTRKVQEIQDNPRCSSVVDDAESGLTHGSDYGGPGGAYHRAARTGAPYGYPYLHPLSGRTRRARVRTAKLDP